MRRQLAKANITLRRVRLRARLIRDLQRGDHFLQAPLAAEPPKPFPAALSLASLRQALVADRARPLRSTTPMR